MKADAAKVNPSDETGIIPIGELLSSKRGDSATSVGDKSIFDSIASGTILTVSCKLYFTLFLYTILKVLYLLYNW